MADKLRLSPGAPRKLRTSPQVWDELERLARNAVEDLSDGGRVKGYSYTLQLTRENRAAVTIVGKGHARNDARKHNKLLRALDSMAADVKHSRG